MTCSRRPLLPAQLAKLRFAALVFDFLVVSSFVLALHFQRATPIRQVLILVLIEAAFRYGIRGGLWLTAASVPVLVGYEALRSEHFDEQLRVDERHPPGRDQVMIALIVGWLVEQVRSEAQRALERATEAEDLRDELGRRADLLDAANRCARALGSSLELDEAFGAFIRELRSLVPFDRTAIILIEHGEVRVMATAGHLADEVLRPGEALPPGALIEEVLRTGETVYRRDMSDHAYPEEKTLVEIGLRSRVAAPLLLGARPIGMLSILRNDAGRLRARRGRAREPARPARRDRRPEHPLVRGRARDGRGAAPALGPARRLRLARLARAAQPDGRRDRRGPDAAGPLARADAATSGPRSWL